jgi:RNA polymerase sigma-70 factor (ECF subfamily)
LNVNTKDYKSLMERLYAQNGALRAFFHRRVRVKADAAELAQEVYLRVLRVPDFTEIRNPEAYLFAIAGNLAKEHSLLDQQRARSVDVQDPSVHELLADVPRFDNQVDGEARIRRLREVLHQLPPKCRAAVIMQYWHGLSYAEIAGHLGVSTHMVKKYLSQALLHCRRRMQRLG